MNEIDIAELEVRFPLIKDLRTYKEVTWENPNYRNEVTADLGMADIEDAEKRLQRFAPFIEKVFPDSRESGGIIESPLLSVEKMKQNLSDTLGIKMTGELLLKCDSHLPISGSIKARGGIYEVLKHAEDLALQHGLITEHDHYEAFASEPFRHFFSQYSIAVGSTGNLGLSIGIMAAVLGFEVYVHMSADAKQWKKDLLRYKGANVIEHVGDFSEAVAQGRAQAERNDTMYFVDDEDSKHLFLGYAVAALRLKKQLDLKGMTIDREHPLFVYLPCGVGGGPGGVTFGLKKVFGEHVHCFFAESVHSPCMLLGLMTGLDDNISVQDIGLDNDTAADGLAVGRPSGLVARAIKYAVSGIHTVSDDRLFALLYQLAEHENLYLEPSALAGFSGYIHLQENHSYIRKQELKHDQHNATHIVWATGGSMVPESEMKEYYLKGKQIYEDVLKK
ncbi:D-serine ammonia-lyase [Cytobacillus gottheilii]|uniref:D-serine ammonia-lyase n=1 Tax=Cytobacillus gottheilii TaxID=859144 RepID=UPI0009BAD658|nr:D-serine ammonia-lyase [Cytobacillus gottheilii]